MTRKTRGAISILALALAGAAATAARAETLAADARAETALAETGECGEVVVAEYAWPAARLSARVLAMLLEDGYGCLARRAPADPSRAVAAVAEAHAAMIRGDGLEPAAVIAPGASPAAASGAEGVAIGAETYGARERGGWFAPAWLLAAHPSIRRIEDAAARPELFSTSAHERPRLHICPKAWPCHADDLALIAQLELEKRFEIVTPASGDALTASLVEAWRQRRPWLGSYWTPSAAVAEHPMTRLETGALEICAGGEAERCRPPHAAEARVAIYPQALEGRAARVAAMLRRYATPPEVVLEALAWRARSNGDATDAALHLLRSRPELWRSWLDAPARERFAQGLAARIAAAEEAAARAQAERDGPNALPTASTAATDQEPARQETPKG